MHLILYAHIMHMYFVLGHVLDISDWCKIPMYVAVLSIMENNLNYLQMELAAVYVLSLLLKPK